MAAIVQINFDYDTSAEELLMHTKAAAPQFLNVEGLLWKIWLGNDEVKGTGGIYLFSSRELAEKYAEGDLVIMLKKTRPNVEVKVFDVLDEPSAITGAALSKV